MVTPPGVEPVGKTGARDCPEFGGPIAGYTLSRSARAPGR